MACQAKAIRSRALAPLALALAPLALLVPVSSARADIAIGGPPPEVFSGAALFNATSADGSRVVFSSRRRLDRADRDRVIDVYLRAGGRTRLLSRRPSGAEPVRFLAATPDARTVLLSPDPRLGGAESRLALVSDDGQRAFFQTEESLLEEDGDDRQDVYEHRDGRLRLVTFGTSNSVRLHAIAADGSRAIVSTNAGLDERDLDGFEDIYAFTPSSARLLSVGGLQSCPAFTPERELCKVVFAAASPDAARVYFETEDRISPLDLDSSTDVYRSGVAGSLLVSTGPGDSQIAAAQLAALGGNGRRVFFVGGGPFKGLAGDTYCGLYERYGGRTAAVSEVRGKPLSVAGCEGKEIAVSKDGSTVVFPSGSGGYRDSSADLYRRARGRTALVSAPAPGPASEPVGAFLKHLSEDGSRVAFLTWRPLVPADIDGGYDLYSRGPKGFTLLTLGPAGGNGAHAGPPGSLIGDVFPQYGGASADGRRVFFSTDERLLRRDRNDGTDLYERGPAGLRLVSTR